MIRKYVLSIATFFLATSAEASEVDRLKRLVDARNQMPTTAFDSTSSRPDASGTTLARVDLDAEIVALRDTLAQSPIPEVATLARQLVLSGNGTWEIVASAETVRDNSRATVIDVSPAQSFQNSAYNPITLRHASGDQVTRYRVIKIWRGLALIGSLHFDVSSGQIALLHIARGEEWRAVARGLLNSLAKISESAPGRTWYFSPGDVTYMFNQEFTDFLYAKFRTLFSWGSGGGSAYRQGGGGGCRGSISGGGNQSAISGGANPGALPGGGAFGLPGY